MLMQPVLYMDPLSSIFSWNRISTADLTDLHIKFSLTPLQRSFELPTAYVIERLKSFGESFLWEMATKIEQLMSMDVGYTE
jgi:hypothetical protein